MTLEQWALAGLVGFAAWAGTGVMKAAAVRWGLLDVPNPRSSHERPTPRGGGAALAAACLGGWTWLWQAGWIPAQIFGALAGGGFLVAAVGLWDDRAGLSPVVRLVCHGAAAAGCVSVTGGWEALAGALPHWVSSSGAAVLWVGLVWLINLTNFMDGIDAIAGVEAVCVMGGIAVLCLLGGHGGPGWAAATAAAAAAGFLFWNLPPARIFMGDVGSGFLGFCFGAVGWWSVASGALSLWSWLILPAVFTTDATLTLLRRMARGEAWMRPHRSHAYQHAARRAGSHGKVSAAVLLVNLGWLFPLAALGCRRPDLGPFAAAAAYAPLLVLAWRLDAGVPGDRLPGPEVVS
ncbi:MAG: glycosyltransferase family 4 protein [Desulfacinum sp.]|jgi:Fuc2NAc and GlcNAc transferase|nr:glycosyltransferase family 4 protein [Desulfacinum sp.]